MKIVIAEFVLGGGLTTETLPRSLAREADMMLQALLVELKQLNLEIGVMLDWRCQHLVGGDVEKIIVQPEDDFYTVLEQTLSRYDIFWPIAPESGQALARMVKTGERADVKTMASDWASICLCSDKLATIEHLAPFVNVPETCKLVDFSPEFPAVWVVKPVDGAGCEQTVVIENPAVFAATTLKLQPSDFIAQAFIPGKSISLSAVFRHGKGWLLTVNEQVMCNRHGFLSLTACRVNCEVNDRAGYQQCIDAVANAIPGLWGYVGIDLVEADTGQMTLLEINPRLTTSYAGVYPATGINVAETILQLMEKEPVLKFDKQATIRIDLTS